MVDQPNSPLPDNCLKTPTPSHHTLSNDPKTAPGADNWMATGNEDILIVSAYWQTGNHMNRA